MLEAPFEFDRKLVAEAPVYRDPNTKLVLVSSFAMVNEALKRHEDFSNRFGEAMAGRAAPKKEITDVMKEGYPTVNTMLTADPPEHKRFRSLVNKAFTPRRVNVLEPEIQKIADELVDAFIGDGRFSVIEQFAVPLTLTVIADQLGVPRSDLADFKRWTDGFVAQLGGMATGDAEIEAARLIVEYQHYFAERLEEAKANPRDDIISDLVRARIDGERPLDVAESLSIIQQLLVAGHETTASSIAAGMLLLMENPDQLALVQENPELLPNMIEEVTRLTTPTQNMWRVATRDCTLGDFEISKGDFVFIRFGAANRDPAKFIDPDRFDVKRENAAEHVAYGHGIHFCIGAMLARKEMLIAFSTLLSRLDGFKLAANQTISHKPSMLLRGLKDYVIEFKA
ncbi:MAG: cytochrome P450 [Myxococcota bacterium]